jgi:hypothetical protein
MHEWIEMAHIEITRDSNNRPVIVHNTDSPFNQIMNVLREEGWMVRPMSYFLNR